MPIFWATGACFCIRSKAFHDLGGFDIDFFAHQEEIDLCWRLQNKGHGVWVETRNQWYIMLEAELLTAIILSNLPQLS